LSSLCSSEDNKEDMHLNISLLKGSWWSFK